MIFVSMVIETQPDRRDAMISAMETMMTTTRLEAGCMVYTYSADLADPNHFHLIEIWENERLMDAHIDTGHSYAFVRALNECGRIASIKAFEGEARKFRIRSPDPR